jgi:hypothetical protein
MLQSCAVLSKQPFLLDEAAASNKKVLITKTDPERNLNLKKWNK